MTSRQAKHLFATRRDLELGSIAIERQQELQYVDCSAAESASPIRYDSLLDLPDLGVNRTGNHLLPAFLVMPRKARVHVQSVPQRKGGVRYVVDQLGNPGSIVFQPGGMFEAKCLVAGHIGTIHDDPGARQLFRTFSAVVTKGFKKVRSYWVGPEALSLLHSGFRLVAMGPDEPPEYDLSI